MAFDVLSFALGIILTSGFFLIIDLVRSKQNLRESRLEVEELKKKLTKKKDKDKSKKKKDEN